MADFLQRIIEVKRREVEKLRCSASDRTPVERNAKRGPRRNFLSALRKPGIAAIAEFKRRSPSVGALGPDADPARTAIQYENAGAAAISVLTDSQFFGGSLDDLRAIRDACTLPVLRKDFLIDPVQVESSSCGGADAILLIARILSDSQLAELHAAATEHELDVLVEVHDEREVERALRLAPAAIGINCRDLDTFDTDLTRSIRLAATLPSDRLRVAESGIRNSKDVQDLRRAGFDAILVGETLMRSKDAEATLRLLLADDVQ